ncbi:MAG: CHRD domain-containing protein [Planctomycetota bacterium]|nr:CHRD domain-containing protein [Planctomycetota bacterium]
MKKIAALAVVALAGAAASADIAVIGPFPLSGAQEVPANASPATGSAKITLDTATGAFTLDYSFSGLTGNVTVAHFHRNVAGVNGPAFYWLAAAGAPNNNPTTLMSPSLPTGVTAHTGSGTGIIPAADITNFLTGRVYINIHSTTFGGGEIRGQVVPAPAALGLAGVAGVVALRRRRA